MLAQLTLVTALLLGQYGTYLEEEIRFYPATVTDCYDGDTCTVLIDQGFGDFKETTIRLYGIDTPEMRGPEKLQAIGARNFLLREVRNKRVTLLVPQKRNNKDKKGKYGRWLAWIFERDRDINKLLVDNGYAIYKKY